MRVKGLVIRNFRALENIEVEFESRVNVIVGPNAIGKTTLLEAIRLAKALLAPRTQSESAQALFALGGAVPHNPQELIFSAIARDSTKPVEIRCRFEFTAAELTVVESAIPEIATSLILNRLGHGFANPAASIAILSSPAGVQALQETEPQLRDYLQRVRNNATQCRLHLQLDPRVGRVNNVDPFGSLIISYIEGHRSPEMTMFSYFPADRAMPAIEQPVQLGAGDASLQLESHISQPQIKYTRLKNTIFSTIIRGEKDRKELSEEFERIFTGILRGRKLASVGVSAQGLLQIKVQDTESGRDFDIEGMSSGEKGLILTFLLIARSIAEGGIVLLDEPELHLNPAVCKDLLNFLVKNYIVRKNIQAIVCSHSPEILAGAFDNEECSLYHLVSENVLTKVRYQDLDEISEALSRLGTSESEGLLYKATVFVEGEDDTDLLELGFADLLRRYKVKDLGGRGEVEKQIAQLQAAEKRGVKLSPRYFIFDLDAAPTNVSNSESVKLLQWDRRCLENYLIDIDVLTDFLKDPETMRTPLSNQAEVTTLLKGLAMAQINEVIAKKVYSGYGFDSPGLRSTEIYGKSTAEIAGILFERLAKLKGQVGGLAEVSWKQEFIQSCEAAQRELTAIWDSRWFEFCDGKRLFAELFRKVVFRLSLAKFKKQIMLQMRVRQTPNWRSMESLLKKLLGNSA